MFENLLAGVGFEQMDLPGGFICSGWLVVSLHKAGNSRQKEQRRKKCDVQIFSSKHEECVEFPSQKRSGVVSMDSTLLVPALFLSSVPIQKPSLDYKPTQDNYFHLNIDLPCCRSVSFLLSFRKLFTETLSLTIHETLKWHTAASHTADSFRWWQWSVTYRL